MSKFKSLFGPLALAVAAVFMNPGPAEAARVLLLTDTESEDTAALESALRAANHTVTKVGPEYSYAGSNLSNFDVVVHMNGTTFNDGESMPVSTQQALVQYVRNGGGFVGAQWLGFEESGGTQINMSDLVLMGGTFDAYLDGCENCTLSVVGGQEAHPVLRGIPATSAVNGGLWDGSPKSFSLNQPTVLMRLNGVNAVLAREVDRGRVVNFTAAMNYRGEPHHGYLLRDHRVLRDLYVNAVNWAAPPVPVNAAPVARIAPPAAVHAGTIVTIDGSPSSDPDGNVLRYRWSLTAKPLGSGAVLSDPSAVMPSFSADVPGGYGVELIVNDGTVDSAPVGAIVSSRNGSPTADAGLDQALVLTGARVQLNGTGSSDPDSDRLTFGWKFVSVPPGSSVMLDNPVSATPSFTPDIKGTYVAELVVTDPFNASHGDSVTVSFNNIAPVADAGSDKVVNVGTQVLVSGSGSDGNGDRLTYRWNFNSVPANSAATLLGADTAAPSFIADVAGTYVLQLMTHDGLVSSVADTAVVEAIAVNNATTATLQDLITYVNGLPNVDAQGRKVFKHKKARRVLVHDLMTSFRMMKDNKFHAALATLKHREKRAMDGCSVNGSADRNDLIRTCAEQTKALQMLQEATSYLEEAPGRAPRPFRNHRHDHKHGRR
jgi:Trehalose utilisation/PKD domain